MDYSLRPQLKPEPVAATAPTSKGLGTPTSKPAEPLQEDWYTRFTKSFTAAGGTLADTPFTDTNPASLYERSEMSLKDFDELTRRSAEVAALNRMEAGISESLAEPGRLKKLDEDESLVPELRPEPEFVDAEDADVPIEPPVDVTEEELEATPVKAEGKGLMSKPATEEKATTTLTDLVYSDFVESKQEGDEAHVGQDNKNITLAGGVVPDGLKYNGKDFTQGASVVTGFDKGKLDTSGAYKTVGSTTVKRSDFDSDKAFAKGVIEEFANQAEAAAGDSWSSMSEGSKKAVVKIGWNKGAGWYSGKSAKAIYAELAKDEPNPENLYSKILVGSTVLGGGASIGIAKARANAWNETTSATGGKEITRIDADNSGTNTKFKYYDKDGNLLHTEETTRASNIYENKQKSVRKNSKGVW